MATINIETLVGHLLDQCGFPEANRSGENNLAPNNGIPEVITPLEQRACIINRIEASVKSGQQAFFRNNPSLQTEKIEVMPKDIPPRDHRQRTEDRKLLRDQMADLRLGGLTEEVGEALGLTEGGTTVKRKRGADDDLNEKR